LKQDIGKSMCDYQNGSVLMSFEMIFLMFFETGIYNCSQWLVVPTTNPVIRTEKECSGQQTKPIYGWWFVTFLIFSIWEQYGMS
jgi:hypothetical protein